MSALSFILRHIINQLLGTVRKSLARGSQLPSDASVGIDTRLFAPKSEATAVHRLTEPRTHSQGLEPGAGRG